MHSQFTLTTFVLAFLLLVGFIVLVCTGFELLLIWRNERRARRLRRWWRTIKG